MVHVALPLPPLTEQRKIVRRVKALFVLIDQLEVRYAKAKPHVEKLTQSILVKAFHGELVYHDPSDEPASVLLARIKQQTDGGRMTSEARKSGHFRRAKSSR
jgi:type I restriction enzyme S subunit